MRVESPSLIYITQRPCLPCLRGHARLRSGPAQAKFGGARPSAGTAPHAVKPSSAQSSRGTMPDVPQHHSPRPFFGPHSCTHEHCATPWVAGSSGSTRSQAQSYRKVSCTVLRVTSGEQEGTRGLGGCSHSTALRPRAPPFPRPRAAPRTDRIWLSLCQAGAGEPSSQGSQKSSFPFSPVCPALRRQAQTSQPSSCPQMPMTRRQRPRKQGALWRALVPKLRDSRRFLCPPTACQCDAAALI